MMQPFVKDKTLFIIFALKLSSVNILLSFVIIYFRLLSQDNFFEYFLIYLYSFACFNRIRSFNSNLPFCHRSIKTNKKHNITSIVDKK